MTFGEFIKTQREAKNWTQPDAANKIGIEQSYLSKLENNKAIPSTDIFDKLMQAYQFDMTAVGQHLDHAELQKLKDIVLVRDFIVTHQKRSETTRRRWLIIGLLGLMLGAALSAYGMLSKDATTSSYLYESKGVLKAGEAPFLFAEMPTYKRFTSQLQVDGFRQQLKQHPLFPRLDYKQIRSPKDLGDFYDVTEDTRRRRYTKVSVQHRAEPMNFYISVSLGAMLLAGALGAFYISRRW